MKKLTVLCMLGLFVLISANTDSIAAPREDTVKKCNDGKDNDRDGDIDELDSDCDGVGEDPGGGGGATFTVEVFYDFEGARGFENINIVSISGVVGTIHGNRHKMGENPTTVDIRDLPPPDDCGAMFTGADSATFTFHTAQIPPSAADLTFISPGLGIIPGTIISQIESFALRFDGGAIADPNVAADCDDIPTVRDWFPGPNATTCFFGDTITWSQISSPTDAKCNGEVPNQRWRIAVTGE